MTTTMHDFYTQPMTVGAGNRNEHDHDPKGKSGLARTFKRIRRVFAPTKKTFERGEAVSKDARYAVEFTLEAESRKGKSFKKKLIEGLDPFSRLQRRRARENKMDTSSDSPSTAARDDTGPLNFYDDKAMACDVPKPEPETALPCIDVDMVPEDDPVVSALADLMARLSISDPDPASDPVPAVAGDSVGAIIAVAFAERAQDLKVTSPPTTGYSPYSQRRRFTRNRGTQLPTLDDCLEALHEEELAMMMDVDEPAPGFPMDVDDVSYASWDSASTLTASTVSDTSTLVSPEDGDPSVLSLAKSFASLTVGKVRAFVGKMALY